MDFSLRYEWAAGSMPPPYHYELVILVNGTSGLLTCLPDYPLHSPPEWKFPFSVSTDQAEMLIRLMTTARVFRASWRKPASHTVGGDWETLSVQLSGKEGSIPARLTEKDAANLHPVYTAIRNLVPAEIWTQIEILRTAFMAHYPG
jgi:hypothetical protein